MAVQFSCPACRQPIEVDDDWAGQHVACPFCQRVVTAPTQSTLRSIETTVPPSARKLSPTSTSPISQPQVGHRSSFNTLAAVGFGCSVAALLLFFVVGILWQFFVDELGPEVQLDAQTQQEFLRLANDPQYRGRFIGGMAAFCLSALCWLAGLIICAIAVTRRGVPGHRLALVGIGCSMLLPAFMCTGFLFR